MARRGGDAVRQVVVSIVGVSGGEREKGVLGLGKSCLCNRFIRPQADQYHIDHISVLSQSDFSGRVVNNDHFLYWGEGSRVMEDGVEYNFQVVEQTEFIDDASFMPFKAGKMETYIKRCCATKIQSAEKLMYICKNQLGIEKEYEQKVLPDGRLNVDGFICVFDVSQVPNRSLERQVEITAAILTNCLKAKRPVVLATTKNDEANEAYVKEAERLASRKEFKGNVPLVETSSHDNVNVDAAFVVLAQLLDKNRGRVRLVPYYEAVRHRKDVLDLAADAFQRLVRVNVADYRCVWASTSKRLAQSPDYVLYVDLFGLDSAIKMFRRHVRRLKDEFLQRKVEGYVDLLPGVLREFFPDLQSLGDGDWLGIQQRIAEHPHFDRYFVRCDADDIPWSENTDLLESADARIPFDVLDSPEAEIVYRNHVNGLQAELEMREMRDRFKTLLQETGYVTPGKRLDEVRVLFMGRESFDSLTEHERQVIYEQHQLDLADRARQNFQELLQEQAELFYHVKSIAPSGTITQEDVREITLALQEDNRYKAMDRMENERTLLLLQHLGFVHLPKREHCPAFPNCMDCLAEKVLAEKAAQTTNSNGTTGSWGRTVTNFDINPDPNVNLVLLGTNGLAENLHEVIQSFCEDDEIELDNQIFSLDYRIIGGDVSLLQNSLRTPTFMPHGVVCAFSSELTLEYVRESLEKTLMTQLEVEEPTPTPPTFILFAPDADLDEEAAQRLHDDGVNLAESLQCRFMDVGPSLADLETKGEGGGTRLDSEAVSQAIRSLLASIQQRNHTLSIFNAPTLQRDSRPDIRVIMCMLCNDPYSLETVLSPLLNHQMCVVTSSTSLSIQAFLDEGRRKVEVMVSSYHGANVFREDLVHGFILVYSAKRRASLNTLRAFSANIPNLPIQILCVTETSGASAFFGSDISHQLITEGNAIADRLQAHFMTSTANFQQKSAFYTPFFKEVWDKKPEIEQAFHMEDPLGLDDSGEGTLERPLHPHYRGMGRGAGSSLLAAHHRTRNLHHPLGSHSAEGSSSEIYEVVPQGDGSFGDDLDDPLSPSAFPSDDPPLSPSDDSDIYSHLDNDEEERLVKPSQLKHRKFQQGSYRQSYPSAESLPTDAVPWRSKRCRSSEPPHLTYQPLPSYPRSASPPPYCYVMRLPSVESALFASKAFSFPHPVNPPPPYSYSPQSCPLGLLGPPFPPGADGRFMAESLRLELGAATGRNFGFSDTLGGKEPSGGGLQVYPPPTTPPEPAPPDRDCDPPTHRLVKATTLPAPTLHAATSRTSLDELTCKGVPSLATAPADLSGSPDSLTARDSGWTDEGISSRRVDEFWNEGYVGPQSFATGRRGKPPPLPPAKPKPKTSQTLKQPGKLNLKAYSNVTDAIGKINLRDGSHVHPSKKSNAPLATPEDLNSDFPQNKEVLPAFYTTGEFGYSRMTEIPQAASAKARQRHRREKGRQAYSDSDSDLSSLERRRGGLVTGKGAAPPKRTKKKRLPIPVAAPRVPPLASFYVSEGGGSGSLASPQLYSDEQLLLEASEKAGSDSASTDSDASDSTTAQSRGADKAIRPPFLPQRKREGVAVRPPTVPPQPLPPPHGGLNKGASSPHTSVLLPLGVAVGGQERVGLFSPSTSRLDGDLGSRGLEDDSSVVSSPRELQSPLLSNQGLRQSDSKEDRVSQKREERARTQEELRNKEEAKKRAKEEEKIKKLAEKDKEREKKKAAKTASTRPKGPPLPQLEDFVQSSEKPVPLFLEKCIRFIEKVGLDSEGIYRVPGNKVHVEQLNVDFKEDNSVDFSELDVPVNAAATALKDYLKQLPPLLPQNKMEELTTIAGLSDRSCRLLKLKAMLMDLPKVNFEVLKFIFNHFVRVTENCKLNSMDSKNLAICWWPTLLHTLQFSDIGEFEAQRPHIEDIVQTMIDQFPFLFLGKEDYVMV